MFESRVVKNPELVEYGKFVEIKDDSRFPAISVTRVSYRDQSNAFPNNIGLPPLTSVEIYPKYGVITYLANATDIVVSLSSGNLDIGDVGLIDHYTTGFNVRGSIIRTNTVTRGGSSYEMGALSVLPYGTTPVWVTNNTIGVSGSMSSNITNTVAISTTQTVSVSVVNHIEIANDAGNPIPISTTQTLPISGSVTVLNPATALQVTNTVAISTTQTLPVSVINLITSVQVYTSSNTLTVSGNTAVTNTVAISTAQTLPVSGSVTITNSISTTPVGIQQVSYADGYQLDQSGRLRVAMIGNQWWYTSSIDKDGDVRFQEAFAGEGQSIYVQNYAATLMTSGSASGGSAIRQTRRRFPLRPGVGQQWFSTWNWDGNDAGVVKRCGWNTQYNGMFFELSGGNMNVVVRRRLPDGTLNESRVSRNEFNGDKLNGSGPSAENWNLPAISAFTTTLAPTVTAVAVQNALSAYNVRYRTTTAQAASAFIIGSKVTVQGFSPITFNGCAVVKTYDTTNSTIDLTYSFNPGTYISGVATGSIIQNAYHGTHTYFLDVFGGRTNRVRFGKITDNGEIILHTFQFDGAFGGCFTSAPTMPVRKEIFTTQNVNLRPTMSLFGVSVNTEAEVELNPSFAVAHNNNYLRLDYNTPAGVGDLREYPLLGVGLRAGEPYQRGDIQIQSINIIDIRNIGGSNNGGALFWRLVLNPTLSGTIPAPTNIGKASRHWEYTVADHSTNSVNISAGAASQGIELLAGYAASVNTIDTRTSLNFLNLGSNVNNTDADIVVLFVRQLSPAANDAQVVASMNIIEAI
jgi:hypothetical protein